MKKSIWRILAYVFVLVGAIGIIFVFSISYFFYQFNTRHIIEENIATLEIVSDVVAGPSWTLRESYPGTIENTLRGVLKRHGVVFIRIINDKDRVIEKSGDFNEVGKIVDKLPEFEKNVTVRDGVFGGDTVKEFSIRTRDGSNLWMGVSLKENEKKIFSATLNIGEITLLLLTITVIVVFLIVRSVFMRPLVLLINAFERLKEKDYDVQLGETKIIEMQNVFTSFNQMVKKVQEAEIRMAEELKRTKEIDRMKSEFISVAAHQLRTPLSAVKWTMKMLIDGDIGFLTHEQRTFLMQGYISNERIINLVNDLLNVARIEEGRFGYKFAMIQIEDLIESIILDVNHKIKEKKIIFKFERSNLAKPPKVKIDPSRIRLVIQNLLDNAIKYTPNGGAVTISVKYSKLGLEVVVKDTGMGIPKDQQKQLFTKFFRGNNAIKSQTEGTGLGLFIVKNIVEKHYGKIWAESEENKGTTFRFTVPFDAKLD